MNIVRNGYQRAIRQDLRAFIEEGLKEQIGIAGGTHAGRSLELAGKRASASRAPRSAAVA